MTEDQEGWCDSLYFYRMTQDVEMLGRAQMTDTTRNVFALAGRLQYQDSLSKVTLTRKPAVITQTEEEDGSVDTVYLGAEKLVYYTVRMCDIDSTVVEASAKRLSDLDVDPVGEFRKKAAEAAAKAAEEEAMEEAAWVVDRISQYSIGQFERGKWRNVIFPFRSGSCQQFSCFRCCRKSTSFSYQRRQISGRD